MFTVLAPFSLFILTIQDALARRVKNRVALIRLSRPHGQRAYEVEDVSIQTDTLSRLRGRSGAFMHEILVSQTFLTAEFSIIAYLPLDGGQSTVSPREPRALGRVSGYL